MLYHYFRVSSLPKLIPVVDGFAKYYIETTQIGAGYIYDLTMVVDKQKFLIKTSEDLHVITNLLDKIALDLSTAGYKVSEIN